MSAPRPFRMWCVVGRSGRILRGTLRDTRWESTFALFDYMPDEFRVKYWKRARASALAYRRLGYRTIPVKVVPTSRGRGSRG